MLLEAMLAAALLSPGGAKWGASPQEVQYYFSKQYKFLSPAPPEGNPDQFLHEQRYSGGFLGMDSDHVAPLFYGGRYFALAVSYSPNKENPASLIWEKLVTKLTSQFGKPKSKTKPLALLSIQAVLRLLPDSANKGQLMEMYNSADVDRRIGDYMIQDLQIQSGGWVPEAAWFFTNGANVKALMRAGFPDANGLRALKPVVVYTNHAELAR